MRLAPLLLCVGCEADLPALTDAQGRLDTACSGPYADTLVDTFPTTLANATAVIGAPDNLPVSVAANNVVTVGFVGLGGVTDAPGPDLRIHGMLNGTAVVRVATSDMGFLYSGEISAASTMVDISIADLTSAIYVRITGTTGTLMVDGVEAIHDKCGQ